MKDLSLSLLSRGCGRLVSSNRNMGRHNGRLDVCFTPQDYYIWKSQKSLLRLSKSGRLLIDPESTLPKTYSTRRGPLLLYSQDLVSLDSRTHSKTRDRRRRVVRRYTRQVEQQLNTLKDLTAAMLSYSNHQSSSSRVYAPLLFPPLHFPPAPDLRCPHNPTLRTSPEQCDPELLVHCRQLPAENQPEAQHGSNGRRVRLDLYLQIPRASRTPTPQMEPWPRVHRAALTPDEPPQQTETNHHRTRGEFHQPNTDRCRATADDGGSCSDGGPTGDGGRDGPMGGKSRGRTGSLIRQSAMEQQSNIEPDPNTSGLFLPPLRLSRLDGDGSHRKNTDRDALDGTERPAQRLPPITKRCPGQRVQTRVQHEVRLSAGGAGFQSQQTPNRVYQQPLVLPLLFPGADEMTFDKQQEGRETTERQNFKNEGGGIILPSEGGSVILLQPEGDPLLPVSVSDGVSGRRGPGRQSSFAFFQNHQDPCESSSADTRRGGVVRGLVPLELRDLQDGRSVGSLILGPDGEVVQLSLFDSSRDSTGDRQRRALQVLSGGEGLPWVVVLQPGPTQTEGDEELDTDVSHILNSKLQHQLVGLHRLADAPSGDANTVFVSQKGNENVSKQPQPDRNKVRMSPLMEQGGGHTEEEEEEEELTSIEDNSHLPGSVRPGQQDTGPSEESEDGWGTRNTQPESLGPDGERRSKGREEEEEEEEEEERRWQQHRWRSDDQSIRKQKGGGAKTQDQTPPPEKKKIRGEEEKNNDKEEEETVKQGEESAGRRKRRRGGGRGGGGGGGGREGGGGGGEGGGGRLKYKESVIGNPQDGEEAEPEHESHFNKKASSAETHRKRAERPPTNHNVQSSVRSVTSLRSSSQVNHSRSTASSSDRLGIGVGRASGLASSYGRLSSCSTIMVTEEQLMLNPMNSEVRGKHSERRSQLEEGEQGQEPRQRAERQRQEVERKRREREEEERKRREREEEERKRSEKEERKRREEEERKQQTEEKMKIELEEERKRRAEEIRLKKEAEEEQRRRRENEEQEQMRREEAQRERERRRREERRRQMEQLQKRREEEELRRKAEQERRRVEEEEKQQEENRRLQEMDENQRMKYLQRKEEEEEERRRKEEELRRREEEFRLESELISRQVAMEQQQSAFKRGLVLEAGGLEKTQGVSRPWIYSYFSLVQALDPESA